MITVDSPVLAVLGEASSARVKAITEGLGIKTVGELLDHFPRRYLKTGELGALSELTVGQMLTLVGEIVRSETKTFTDRRSNRPAYRQEVQVLGEGGTVSMTFFSKKKHIAEWQAARLAVGRRGVFAGQVGRFRDQWQLTNPQMDLFGPDPDASLEAAMDQIGSLYPLYPLTKGIHTWDLAKAISFARTVVEDLPELLPEDLRTRQRLPDVDTAYAWIHAPEDEKQVREAQRRFRFEEALITQLVLARRRVALRAQGTAPRIGGGGLLAAFDSRLPFELTEGQREIGTLIESELAREHPMNRLLQGEVGSGKTVVALRAMLRVVDSGGQAVLLAPTEVLAQQHHRSTLALLGDLGEKGLLGGADEATQVVLLTGSATAAQRREALLEIASGAAGIVIGTHALLEEVVQFADLGLVVIDEQHRFGVEQRAVLAAKSAHPPHVLVMTATPIPRTVAMTVFGDLEVSTLRELPAGRAAITTNVVPLAEQPHWLDRVWQRLSEEVAAGRQAYVVCPRITGDIAEQGEADAVDLDEEGNPLPGAAEVGPAAVETIAELLSGPLSSGPMAGVSIGLLHGRLSAEEKDRTMQAFAAGEIDVLVATTVIEVGVDVPNASAMVVLDADRFGVSQLHQLRGRVGRGGHPGLCLLVTHAAVEGPARERLEAVAASTDGFLLSRVDLEQRREGDVLGASQAGRRSSLHRLRVLRDEDTILAARSEAERLVETGDLDSLAPLRAAVTDLERSVESGYMEKT